MTKGILGVSLRPFYAIYILNWFD